MTPAQSDRLKASLTRFIASCSPTFDFGALYPGTIVAPGTQPNTFDFSPDNSDLLGQGLQNVPARPGIPGVTLTVDPGATPRCYLGWEESSPDAPFLALFSLPGLSTLQIQASQSIALVAPGVNLGANPGQAAVGRVGDQVQVTIPAGAVLVSVTAGPPAVGVPNPLPITLTGKITTGAAITRAS